MGYMEGGWHQTFAPLSKLVGFWPKNGQIWPKMHILGHFGPNIGLSDPQGAMRDQKVPKWFSDVWVPELLFPHKIVRMFCPKTAIFAPKYAILGTFRPCWLIWYPVGWLVAVPRGLLYQQSVYLVYYISIFQYITTQHCAVGSFCAFSKHSWS